MLEQLQEFRPPFIDPLFAGGHLFAVVENERLRQAGLRLQFFGFGELLSGMGTRVHGKS